MTEIASWRKEATTYTQKARVCLDRALVAEFEEAAGRLHPADEGTMLEETPTELENHVADLEKRVEARTTEFVFRNIGPRAWKALIGEHPPTDDKVDQMAGYNVVTFVPAALAETCVSPGLSIDDAEYLVHEQDQGVKEAVISACFDANVKGGDEKKAAATVAVARSRKPSTPR